MRVEDIIKRVRNVAGDINVMQFKDDVVLNWINDAMRECAADNNLLQRTASQNAIAKTNKYSIPEDILKLHSVRYDHQAIPVITLQEATERGYLSSAVGNPEVCWVWAGKLELHPAPSGTDLIEINYTRNPAEVLGLQDEPELPTSYHMRLVDYCLAQVAQQDDDLNRYSLKMEEFRTGIQKLRDQPEWEDDLYPTISVSLRDFDGGEDYAWW